MSHKLPKSRRDLLPLLEAAGLKAHRKWGQSFLLDANMLESIARDAAITKHDLVLEIGPGPATLTEYLIDAAGFVVSVEVDRGMAGFIAQELSGTLNFALLNEDALEKKNTLNERVRGFLDGMLAGRDVSPSSLGNMLCQPPSWPQQEFQLKVVANLPYSVASPLVIALLESGLPIESMTLLFQYEVAQRLCAQPGEKAYGLLTLLRQVFADASIVRKVPNTCFWPKPKITSGLVRIEPLREPRVEAELYPAFKKVASGMMRFRRKNLINAAQHGLELEREAAHALIVQAGLDPECHAESLVLEDYVLLARAYSGDHK